MKIILGSASTRRQKLLSDWGYAFDVLIPQIDEKAFRSEDLRTLPLMVATAKAESLRGQINQPAVLITCDTIVAHNNQLYEKPKDESDARRMLQSYGAGPAEVICGVAVINTENGRTASGVDSAKVYFHKIPHSLVEEMIKHGRIFDFAGAFHPDDPPIKPYIVHIEGEVSTVMGLPEKLTKKLINEISDGK